MPYSITRLKTGKYQVKNLKTKEITAKGTTKIKAEAQVRLLNLQEKQKYKK